MPVTAYDTGTNANDVTWPKCHVEPYFYCTDVRNEMVPLRILLVSHGANATVKCIKWPKKSCSISFQLSWASKCSGDIDDAIGIRWLEKSCYISFWPSRPKMKWCHWWHCWDHVTLTASLASYDQDSYIEHCFSYLDVISAVALLTMALASHAADASANSVRWLKRLYWISFQSSWTNNWNDTISIMWCQGWHHDQKVMLHLVSVIFT